MLRNRSATPPLFGPRMSCGTEIRITQEMRGNTFIRSHLVGIFISLATFSSASFGSDLSGVFASSGHGIGRTAPQCQHDF